VEISVYNESIFAVLMKWDWREVARQFQLLLTEKTLIRIITITIQSLKKKPRS